jgi:endo-1,4-beta-D-glucanase Y
MLATCSSSATSTPGNTLELSRGSGALIRKDSEFWYEAATTSREFFKQAAHPETGLMPDHAEFDGSPAGKWRYYDGMLYVLSLLHTSGSFRVYPPAAK